MNETNGRWTLSADDLQALVKDNTKMTSINNPANPTGTALSRNLVKQVVEIARAKSLLVLSDEVFRPLFHGLSAIDDQPPSSLEFDYENTIVTGSMSKAYALPGIRLGWVRLQQPLFKDRVPD